MMKPMRMGMVWGISLFLGLTPLGWAASSPERLDVAPHASTQDAEKERAKVLEEAVTVLAKTGVALRQLEAGKKSQALDTLALISGKLDVLTAAHPELALAPVDVQLIVRDFPGDIDAIEQAVKQAGEWLDDGRVQQARALLSSLASEVDIRVSKLPLATYPAAIKRIVPLVETNNIEEAKEALVRVMNTLVVEDHITPLPVLRAEEMLSRARKIANKDTLQEKERKEVNALLQGIRAQLKRAEALGYGSDDHYRLMYEEIDALQKKLREHEEDRGLLDVLKQKLAEFHNSFL